MFLGTFTVLHGYLFHRNRYLCAMLLVSVAGANAAGAPSSDLSGAVSTHCGHESLPLRVLRPPQHRVYRYAHAGGALSRKSIGTVIGSDRPARFGGVGALSGVAVIGAGRNDRRCSRAGLASARTCHPAPTATECAFDG